MACQVLPAHADRVEFRVPFGGEVVGVGAGVVHEHAQLAGYAVDVFDVLPGHLEVPVGVRRQLASSTW
ncbi:hypothetical protein BIV24_12335 [Streptomyces colonosanans]|uniref:Uncharacterized protein n=1 Tax=Streptomyces colonosanans TaxID=1428652 RepID=A0A1S2PHL9_9ACTN|nr:hypothetical protein BIV24_12335 [Streptomyces colonosanans]